MIILKLGGSVITKKGSEKPALDPVNLDRIAREIYEANIDKLVIVHGAGSFGHPYASKFQIGSEIKDIKEYHRKKRGFTLTQNAVQNLNHYVCNFLLKHGIPAIAVPPSSFMVSEGKRIKTADLTLVEKYLEKGMVPVLHGDVVLDDDENIQMAVISGDQIINYLAVNLKADRIILGSDVDGIYNRDPKGHPDAQLLKHVQSLEDLEFLEGATTVDVTGGMAGKLKELLLLAEKGIESEIINASIPGIIKSALKGEPVLGTVISK